MLVATQSFTCEYDGETIAIHRGVTNVADDHELVRRYPQRFTRDGVTRTRSGGLAGRGGHDHEAFFEEVTRLYGQAAADSCRLAALEARTAEIDARMDELVNRHPALKSHGRRRR